MTRTLVRRKVRHWNRETPSDLSDAPSDRWSLPEGSSPSFYLLWEKQRQGLSVPAVLYWKFDSLRLGTFFEKFHAWYEAARETHTDSPSMQRSKPAEMAQERPSAALLEPYRGKFVAIRDGQVVHSAESPVEVILYLRQRGESADSMFRVPVSPELDRLGIL